MALIVKIFINEREIAAYSAVRKHGQQGQCCTYRLQDGSMIDHNYDDGAEALAAKVLLHQLGKKGG